MRTHKYLPKGTVSLDNTNLYNIKLEEYRNSCKCPEDIEGVLDKEHFKVSLLDYMSKNDIEEIRKGIEAFKEPETNFEWLGI